MSLLALLLIRVAIFDTAPCNDPQTQSELTKCAYLDYQTADAQLNVQWKISQDRMKNLDESRDDDGRIGHAEALLIAQRDWIKYRDSHCLTEGFKARGGSMEPMLTYGCLTNKTLQRIGELKDLAIEG